MLQQILIRLPISDRGCASLLRAPLQIPFQTIRGTSAHARYLGIDHAKTQCTLTKNKKNAMSPERATPQHAYVQRFVSHLCTQEKFVKNRWDSCVLECKFAFCLQAQGSVLQGCGHAFACTMSPACKNPPAQGSVCFWFRLNDQRRKAHWSRKSWRNPCRQQRKKMSIQMP